MWRRTIVSASNPRRHQDSVTINMRVWFEELNGPVEFAASPFDCERHGKELWIRAMAGEYGAVDVLPTNAPKEVGTIYHDAK